MFVTCMFYTSSRISILASSMAPKPARDEVLAGVPPKTKALKTVVVAPKRARAEALAGLPPKTTALKTLVEEGILNGYAFKSKIYGRNSPYASCYKNQGIRNEAARRTAKHILHSNLDDRGRYWDMLIAGKTSICTAVKLIEAYRKEHAKLRVYQHYECPSRRHRASD